MQDQPFFLGILYQNLDTALDLIKNWKAEEVLNAYKEAPKKGLRTLLHNKSFLYWGKIFLKLSEEGLRKRSIKNKNGKDAQAWKCIGVGNQPREKKSK